MVKLSQDIQEFFYEDATLFVCQIAVQVNQLIDRIHCLSRAVLQGVAIQQMTDEYSREQVTGTMKLTGNLFILQMEVFTIVMVVASHAVLSVDTATGNQHRLTANLMEFVE